MMNNRLKTLAVLAAVAALAACGDATQTANGVGSDDAPHTGVGKSQYLQAGWQVGNRESWAQQLKARAQYGMNEYTRAANP